MNAAQILAWARLGSEFVTILQVPVASVIRLFKDAGGTDEEALLLQAHWQALSASIEARIAALKAAGA